MARLAADRLALEVDRAAFIKDTNDKLARDEMDKARVYAAAPPPDVVKLNVGGVRFETSRALLTKVDDSMLGLMFGRCDSMLKPAADGSIYIDRDGERFRLILDLLRDVDGAKMLRTLRALPECAMEAMVAELDYFGLEELVFGARPWADSAVFRQGPVMRQGRSGCCCVFLQGKAIVFGGHSGASALNTTELLDASTSAFSKGPNLLKGRSGCAAVMLDLDRVLVVGGSGGTTLKTTEILTLSTLTVAQGPSLLSARYVCAAVSLDSKRILVVGGENAGFPVASTEILCLDSMAFTQGPSMATPRSGCAAVALDEGRILVCGGDSDSGPVPTTEILDLKTMQFSNGPPMSSARWQCCAVALDLMHVLVLGGKDSDGVPLATCELLVLSTMHFEPGPCLLSGRYAFTATRFDSHEDEPRILVLGGEDSGVLASTEMLVSEDRRRE